MKAPHRLPQPLILAAGQGSRLNHDKASLLLAGKSCLDRILSTCHKAGLPQALVVSGAHWTTHQNLACSHQVRWIYNKDWAQGRTGSLQCALKAEAAPAWLLWPVDIPLPGPEIVTALAAAWQERQPELCIPSFQHRRGHPIIMSASIAQQVLDLGPDDPLRALFHKLPDHHIAHVEVNDPSVLWDIDVKEDWQRLDDEAQQRDHFERFPN